MTRYHRFLLIVILLLLSVGGGLAWLLGESRPPAGQPRLIALEGRRLERIRQPFNEAVDKTRVMLLLSPT